MLASITVRAEHLGGPCDVRVEAELEPNNAPWNTHTFVTMCQNLNELLAAMFAERDRVKFEEETPALRTVGQTASDRRHD